MREADPSLSSGRGDRLVVLLDPEEVMVATLPRQSVLQCLHLGMVAEGNICRNFPNTQKKVTGSHQLSEAESKCCFCELHMWRCFEEKLQEEETQNPGLGKPMVFPTHILLEQCWKPHVLITSQPTWIHQTKVKVTSAAAGLPRCCCSQCKHWQWRVGVATLLHPFICQDHLWSAEPESQHQIPNISDQCSSVCAGEQELALRRALICQKNSS